MKAPSLFPVDQSVAGVTKDIFEGKINQTKQDAILDVNSGAFQSQNTEIELFPIYNKEPLPLLKKMRAKFSEWWLWNKPAWFEKD